MGQDEQVGIGVLVAFERQVQEINESMAVLKQDSPSRYEKAKMMDQDEYSTFMWASIQSMKGGNPDLGDPFPFKPRDLGGNFACYLIAELNYANGIAICSLISDPKLKQKCLDKNRKTYCDAWELCGGSEK